MIRRALLFATWLLLNQSVSVGHVLLGAVIALAMPLPRAVPLRRPGLALRLLGVLLWDIVVANVDVLRRVSGRDDAIHPRRLVVPLALRTDEGVAALATMVTLTPGTISAAVAPDRRSLEVHVLHVDGDGDDVVQTIRDRYERPLLEIFG